MLLELDNYQGMDLRLPVELWDNILDHLWEDRDSLAECSLVCRTWLPAARTHLFHTVALVRLKRKRDYTGKLQAFHRICPFIRRLKLRPLPQIFDDRFLPYFHTMIKVNTIIVSPYKKSGDKYRLLFNDRLAQLPLSFIRSIKNMEIERVDVETFAKLLSVFRQISVLDIGLITFQRSSEFVANDPPLGMAVTQLTVRGILPSRAAPLLTWLGNESGGRHPRTFRLLVQWEMKTYSLYSTMLRTIGANLQHLWLTRSYDPPLSKF